MAYYKDNKKSAVKVLDGEIKAGTVKGAYTFFGEEEYLKKAYLDRISEKLLGGERDGFSYTVLDSETYSFDALADSVESVPMLSANKVITVRDLTAEQIKEDSGAIKNLLSGLDESTVVIFYFDADFLANKDYYKNKSRRDLINGMSAFSTVVEFEKMRPEELSKWACKIVFKAGSSITEGSALYLCERCAFDMGKIRNEALKLAAYKPQGFVERADIDAITSPSIEADVFALSKHIVSMSTKKIWETVEAYKLNKESPTAVLYNMASAFYEMSAAKAAVMSGINDVNAVMSDFGISKNKEYFIRNYMGLCKNIPPQFFVRITSEAAGCDKAFKEGDGESWEKIEMLCLKAVNILKEEKRKSDSWLS